MQLEHLRYFQAVAKYGSMNKAAQALFCSQPTITNAVKSLEEELEAPLLMRTGKGVVPTALGNAVLQDVGLMLGYLDRWKHLAQDNSGNNPIVITLTGTAPRYDLVKCILAIRRSHPEICVKLQHSPSMQGEITFANNSDFRFGISYRIPQHMSSTIRFAMQHGMQVALLQKDEFVLFMNSEHPLAQKTQDLVLEDLRGRDIMLFQDPKKFPYIRILNNVQCKYGIQMWHEENLMLTLALEKEALAFRPRRTADHRQYVIDGQVCLRPVVDCPMPVNLCLFYPEPERLSQQERIFLRCLKEYYPEFQVFV